MSITVDAIYEDGMLKPSEPLALQERQRVQVTVHAGPSTCRRSDAVVAWPGSLEDLDYLISDANC